MLDNYYDILQVDKDATIDQIKKKYKTLALKYHPDKNKTTEATDMFTKISNAYQILSDPEKRMNYDQSLKRGNTQEVVKQWYTFFVDPFELFFDICMFIHQIENIHLQTVNSFNNLYYHTQYHMQSNIPIIESISDHELYQIVLNKKLKKNEN